MRTRGKSKSGGTYLGVGPQHHYQKDTKDRQECNCNVTERVSATSSVSSPFPRRLTSEHAISHCLRLTDEHWNAEPADVDIGSKPDDAEGEEHCKLEEDPGLRFGSSFVPLLSNFRIKLSAVGLIAARRLVQYRLCHLMRIWIGECVQPTLASGWRGRVNDCVVRLGWG